MTLPVGILGAGSFGRGLALASARVGRRVVLWSRRERDLGHENITCTTDLAGVREAELIFVAVPSSFVEELATNLGAHIDGSHLLVHVSRGLLGDELEPLTRVLRRRTPARRVGALAGPLVADSLVEGEPGGGIVGSLFPEVANAVREAIGGPRLRIYNTDDVLGVEMASAFVGLIALTIGYAQGNGFGPGTLAVLATRGVAESARVAVRKGANERTFSGLAGYGDLIAAVAGDERPELKLGRALAEGVKLEEAAKRVGAYVEGVFIAKQVAAFAERYKLEAPIARGMAGMIAGEVGPKELLQGLMTRPVRRE